MSELIYPVIKDYIKKLNIELSDQQISKLECIVSAMLADPLYRSVSKILDPAEIGVKHILDSLAPLSFELECWKNKKSKIVDLGTGAGFPSFPLSVALPESNVIAVDSRKKSAEFVSRIAEKVGSKNISGLHFRAEEMGRDSKYREKFDLVICRALAEVRILLEYCLPLAKKGGYVLFYKGPKIDEELAIANNALSELGVPKNSFVIKELAPPNFPFQRNFLLLHKTFNVPSKYPRQNGKPRSKPL